MTTTYLTPSEASEYIGRQFPDGSGILDDAVSAVSRMIDSAAPLLRARLIGVRLGTNIEASAAEASSGAVPCLMKQSVFETNR